METKIKELLNKLESASSVQEAAKIKKNWVNENIVNLQKQLLEADVEKKKELGKEINYLKKESDNIFNEIRNKLEGKSVEIKPKDLSIENKNLSCYSFNPLSQIKKELIHIFNNLNFKIESGKEIVSTEDNFEGLCIDEEHPSRSKNETFYIDEFTILRPHCTVNTFVHLKKTNNKEKGVKLVTIGSVYRKDDESTRHTHQFSQLDFVWVDKDLNIGNLKWMLVFLCNRLFGKEKEYRFRNSYFPFTQPSFEMDIKCDCCGECGICKGTGWIEILGAGMLKKEILNKTGYSTFEALAGGLGLERIALIKYGIQDIRDIYINNFEFLKRNDY